MLIPRTSLFPPFHCHPQVQSQHSLHENGALVPLGDLLYVTGGRWQGMDGDYHVEMEAYDTVRDAWARHGSLPRLWLYHGASTIFLDVSKWTQPFIPTAPQEH